MLLRRSSVCACSRGSRGRRAISPDSDTSAFRARLETWLAGAESVAYARFAPDGRLLRANARFLAVTAAREGEQFLSSLVAEGQRERIADLMLASDLPPEPMHLHFAAADVDPVTLLVTWLRDGDELVLIGEAPVGDLEAAQEVLVKLNRQVSDLARENARQRRQLEAANEGLEARVSRRTLQLESANREMEAFVYSAAHDLRSPLRAIDGFSAMISEDAAERLDENELESLQRVRSAAQRMAMLLDHLMALSRAARKDLVVQDVDVSLLAAEVCAEVCGEPPERPLDLVIAPGLAAQADRIVVRDVLANLISNAWKYTSGHASARIEIGATDAGGERAFFVRDDGAGFDMEEAKHLFGPFQRYHSLADFPGDGIGLATVQRLLVRHGGRVWAESAVEQGATFYFTLGTPVLE
jgi:signal transduction histidine kinase